MTTFTYAGIGSRQTPADTLALICRLAACLGDHGATLRTGGADGADQAFAAGAERTGGRVEQFLPLPRFRGITRAP